MGFFTISNKLIYYILNINNELLNKIHVKRVNIYLFKHIFLKKEVGYDLCLYIFVLYTSIYLSTYSVQFESSLALHNIFKLSSLSFKYYAN